MIDARPPLYDTDVRKAINNDVRYYRINLEGSEENLFSNFFSNPTPPFSDPVRSNGICSYRAIIDVGAGLKAFNITKLADAILTHCNKDGIDDSNKILAVVYSRVEGEKDELVYRMRAKDGTSGFVSVLKQEIDDSQRDQMLAKLFAIYDQAHCVGTDNILVELARAILIYSHDVPKAALLQAIMRLRRFNKHTLPAEMQSIDFGYNNRLMEHWVVPDDLLTLTDDQEDFKMPKYGTPEWNKYGDLLRSEQHNKKILALALYNEWKKINRDKYVIDPLENFELTEDFNDRAYHILRSAIVLGINVNPHFLLFFQDVFIKNTSEESTVDLSDSLPQSAEVMLGEPAIDVEKPDALPQQHQADEGDNAQENEEEKEQDMEVEKESTLLLDPDSTLTLQGKHAVDEHEPSVDVFISFMKGKNPYDDDPFFYKLEDTFQEFSLIPYPSTSPQPWLFNQHKYIYVSKRYKETEENTHHTDDFSGKARKTPSFVFFCQRDDKYYAMLISYAEAKFLSNLDIMDRVPLNDLDVPYFAMEYVSFAVICSNYGRDYFGPDFKKPFIGDHAGAASNLATLANDLLFYGAAWRTVLENDYYKRAFYKWLFDDDSFAVKFRDNSGPKMLHQFRMQFFSSALQPLNYDEFRILRDFESPKWESKDAACSKFTVTNYKFDPYISNEPVHQMPYMLREGEADALAGHNVILLSGVPEPADLAAPLDDNERVIIVQQPKKERFFRDAFEVFVLTFNIHRMTMSDLALWLLFGWEPVTPGDHRLPFLEFCSWLLLGRNPHAAPTPVTQSNYAPIASPSKLPAPAYKQLALQGDQPYRNKLRIVYNIALKNVQKISEFVRTTYSRIVTCCCTYYTAVTVYLLAWYEALKTRAVEQYKKVPSVVTSLILVVFDLCKFPIRFLLWATGIESGGFKRVFLLTAFVSSYARPLRRLFHMILRTLRLRGVWKLVYRKFLRPLWRRVETFYDNLWELDDYIPQPSNWEASFTSAYDEDPEISGYKALPDDVLQRLDMLSSGASAPLPAQSALLLCGLGFVALCLC
jgi:hypothetical protein